jgi:hypothetical protein
MWPVVWYTSYDAIRGILGVSAAEDLLLDADLGGEGAEAALHRDLVEVHVDLPATYAAIRDTPYAERSAVQHALLGQVASLATLSVARALSPALPMAAKTIGDGKASMSRFADGPYRDTLARIEERFQIARNELATTLAEVTGEGAFTVPTPVLLRAAGAAVDRVTGGNA